MSAKNGSIKLVAGNSNPALAKDIASFLKLPMTKAVVRRFADMEIFVEIQENVRGSDAFIIQSTSYPANDHLMELLIITDALRRSSARRITAVIPYFGYARQDRKSGSRTPISAKLVANLITRAGIDRVMTIDLHAGQIQGFFDIPTDNLFASPVMVRDIKERFDLANVMVVSPDVGGVVRARGLAKRFNTPLAIIDKRRGDERDRRRRRLHLHSGRRHRRLRRHAGERRRRAARQRRQGSLRLHHPRRALRRRGGAHRRLQAERACHHRFDSAHRSGPRRHQYPHAADRLPDR
jgi:phosphoribosylpyrophosphate synthetase